MAQNQEKRAILLVFRSFLLTLSKLQFWEPRQLFQPIQFTPEVLSLLPSTLLLSLISKSSQNLEISAILLVFRSFFAKAQLTLILTNTSIVKALWTYTWGIGTATLHLASLLDNKKGSKPSKMSIFTSFPLFFFANAQ